MRAQQRNARNRAAAEACRAIRELARTGGAVCFDRDTDFIQDLAASARYRIDWVRERDDHGENGWKRRRSLNTSTEN
jgi:hypothetical protein